LRRRWKVELSKEIYDYIGEHQGCDKADIFDTFYGDYDEEEIAAALDKLAEERRIVFDREYCFTECRDN
jgi:hypothetical protein